MGKRESNKRWAEENREHIKAYNHAYYLAKKDKLNARKKERYETDPEYRAAAKRRAEEKRKLRLEGQQANQTA